MRTQRFGNTVKVWASARDTYDWAHKPGAAWPCSTLSGHRFYAEFQGGDLVDLTVDGSSDEPDFDGHEFNAFIQYMLGTDHPGEM